MRTLIILFFAPALGAQINSVPTWSDLRLKNPAGLEFGLRLIEPRVYRQGELIRLEEKFPGQGLTPGQPPPQEKWQFGGFLIEPQVECGSLQKPCLMTSGSQFGLFGPAQAFGTASEPLIVVLNDYIPALPPGEYRIAALARKLVLTGRGPMSTSYGYADPPQYAVSGTVEFEVAPATPAWIHQTLANSVATLKSPQPNGREAYQARAAAAQQLRFLDNAEAWRASLDLLPLEEGTFLRGLAATHEPARVCELMRVRLPAPEQSVSSAYLSAMTQVCGRADLPPPPAPRAMAGVAEGRISSTPPPLALAGARPDRELEAYFEKRRAYESTLMSKATSMLAGSLPQKQAEPKATAFATLLQYIQQLGYNQPPQPAPEWTPALTQEFVRYFPSVEVSRQRYLLDLFASTIASPELVPLLESVLDAWKPGDYYEAAHSAIRSLYNVDPARAQARILAELRKARTWLDTSLLDLLPASAVPPMDDALIEALAAAQRPGGWSAQLSMAALAKYGTPRALPRIKAIYESQQQPCQPELMAYFVRVDPAYADGVFRSHAWDMQVAPPRCTVQYFERTPRLAMHSVLEKYLDAYLMHSDVHVKTTAAHSLGRYGSAAAQAPLWDTFRYFHEYWKGKGAELAKNGEGIALEVELRNAIARGNNWLMTETDLRTIESLCISERCLYETQQDLAALQKPLRIEILEQPGGVRGAVAQYYGIETVTALEARLAQFPRGTQFVLMALGLNIKQSADEIRSFAQQHGLLVTDPPTNKR